MARDDDYLLSLLIIGEKCQVDRYFAHFHYCDDKLGRDPNL